MLRTRLDEFGRGKIGLAELTGAGKEMRAAFARRAKRLIAEARSSEASSILRALCLLDPEDANLHAWLGWLQLDDADPECAAESFRRAVNIAPSARVYRAYLIEALLGCARFEAAAAQMQALLDGDPECADPATLWAKERVLASAHRLGIGAPQP